MFTKYSELLCMYIQNAGLHNSLLLTPWKYGSYMSSVSIWSKF